MEKQQVRTHTYFMSMKEYKKKFLKNEIVDNKKYRLNTDKTQTRTHIIFN
tara:strand:- start:303 stop:452 length:150 start_codon:yes stop_codon:yes gene_type:complete